MDEQYFSDSSPASADEIRTIEVSARGFDLSMRVSSRVFSGSKLDLGTRQLLENAPDLPEDGTFLDLGCGWGPIATIMSLESPNATVWAVDVNSRAVDLTQRNAQSNGASRVRALKAEEALASSQKSASTESSTGRGRTPVSRTPRCSSRDPRSESRRSAYPEPEPEKTAPESARRPRPRRPNAGRQAGRTSMMRKPFFDAYFEA